MLVSSKEPMRPRERSKDLLGSLDPSAARAVLRAIREKDSRNSILLITEGLFSMDADSPDLRAFQEVANEFEATLFVDVAHDLGATGPGGWSDGHSRNDWKGRFGDG